MDNIFRQAAKAIRCSEAVVISAGAGMGVDSGLPDFRGNQGFWNAYPAYAKLGMSFYSLADPEHFDSNPKFGWGFYGHRLEMYRQTQPHEGFAMLKKWIEKLELEYFIVTSNVDGQFQKAGFSGNRICEIHGSIHYNQCCQPCEEAIWYNSEPIEIDFETMHCSSELPKCRYCESLARPNILMFGDWKWVAMRTEQQRHQRNKFLNQYLGKNIVVIEMGAGTAIPSIRYFSESLDNATVIRINPREFQIAKPHIAIAEGALSSLQKIDAILF